MAKKNFFSILTPTKNRAATFLVQTIQSVQRQRLDGFDYEHIIVDDGSTDNTREVVRELAKKDPKIKYIRLSKSLGPAKALNRGLKISSGEFITTLDDDDLLPRSSLQLRYKFMRQNPSVDWSSGYLINIDKDNQLYSSFPEQISPEIPSRDLFKQLLQLNTIKNNTVTVRHSCLLKVKGWDEKVKAGQDWALWMDLAYHGFKYALIKNYLALYRVHDQQRSTAFSKNAAWKITQQYFFKKYNV